MNAQVSQDASMAVMPRTRFRGARAVCAALVVLGCCAAPGGAWSAQGGKAEPLRLRIARGRSSAAVSGVLRGDAQREYVLQARRGQSLTIRMAATPPRSFRVTAWGPGGSELPLHADTRVQWSATLPSDGDYELWIARVAARQGSSRYRVTVTLH
jgi:hypothetical protein